MSSSAPKGNELHFRFALGNSEDPNARLYIKTPGTRGAWIHDETVAVAMHERSMCVAEDDDVSLVTRQQLRRCRAPKLVAVTDVN